MNKMVRTVLLLATLCILYLPVGAECEDVQEIVVNRFGMEETYFHGPIPIALSSPTENDISQEQALRIAQDVVYEELFIPASALLEYPHNVYYVTLSNVEGSYRMGGWVVTCFFGGDYGFMQIVIMEGTSGKVLFYAHGAKSGFSWVDSSNKYVIALGSENFQWPIEWNAACDTVFRLPGDTSFRHVLPTDNDITQDEALAIAKKTYHERYGIPKQEIEQYAVECFFVSGWIDGGGQSEETIWNIGFCSAQVSESGYMWPIGDVLISSTDGEVIYCPPPYLMDTENIGSSYESN